MSTTPAQYALKHSVAIICAVGCSIVAVVIVCFGKLGWRDQPVFSVTHQRFADVVTVKIALAQYREDHQVLPSRLSLLCPNYIAADQMNVWFPNRIGFPVALPKSLSDISRIDENCDYLYFPKTPIVSDAGRHAPFMLILSERPYPAAAKTQFVVIVNDLSSRIVTRQELEDSLSRSERESISR
jgi:hypothetical protein